MNRILPAAMAIVLAAGLAGCSSEKPLDISSLPRSSYEALESETVSVKIVDDELDTDIDSVDLLLANSAGYDFIYGPAAQLEVEKDGEWYRMPLQTDDAWDMNTYILPSGGISSLEMPIKKYYGELQPGHYRIVKELEADGQSVFAGAEFTIA